MEILYILWAISVILFFITLVPVIYYMCKLDKDYWNNIYKMHGAVIVMNLFNVIQIILNIAIKVMSRC